MVKFLFMDIFALNCPCILSLLIRSQAVLITGATYGIGRAILEKFSREGRRVIAVARSRDKLKDLVKDIRSRGGEADYLCADLSDPNAVKKSIPS